MNLSHAGLFARLAKPEDNFVERKSDGIKPADIRKTVASASTFEKTKSGQIQSIDKRIDHPDRMRRRYHVIQNLGEKRQPLALRREGGTLFLLPGGYARGDDRLHGSGARFLPPGTRSLVGLDPGHLSHDQPLGFERVEGVLQP